MALTLQNNYSKLKNEFKADTGLDADKDKALYIAYYNARVNDMNYQVNHYMSQHIANQLDMLPGTISLRIAEVLKEVRRNFPQP